MSKILFIEDDPDQIFMYQNEFEMAGLKMMSAANKKEALAFAAQDKPDLILLDLLLGNEDGLDVLKELKADESAKNIPVVVFTNFERKGIREEAKDLGAEDFVMKIDTTPGQAAEMAKEKISAKKSLPG